MRRIAVFRDGNMMGAMIGPDLAIALETRRKLAWIIEEHGYTEQDFLDLDWTRIAAELPLVSR